MNFFEKSLKNPRLAIKVLFHRYFPFGRRKYCHFIILTRSRTGSNMLVSFLNSHPNVYSEGEVLSRLNGQSWERILKKSFSSQAFFVRAKGFKIFYYHPQDGDSTAVFDALSSMPDLHIIHLKRRNILRTIISRKLAEAQGVWKSYNCFGKGQRFDAISLTPNELLKGFKETREWEKRGESKFRHHPVLDIFYEDLVAEPSETFKRITDFLEVRYVFPKTWLKKQNSHGVRSSLTNYDELKNFFDGTEWASFFYE